MADGIFVAKTCGGG